MVWGWFRGMVWQLGEYLATGLIVWMAAIIALVALKMLTGKIPLRGLLSAVPGGAIDPTRVQSASVFLIVIGGYALNGLNAVSTGAPMPDVPESLLVLLAGSSGIYLSGKVITAQPPHSGPPPPHSPTTEPTP